MPGAAVHQQISVTAVHVLNNDAPLFFEQNKANIDTIFSDNGRKYCGRPDRHSYELFLQLVGIAHRTTGVQRSQSNGFVERLHRTLLDERLRIKGREKWYESVEEMQTDHDVYPVLYSTKRPHHGRDVNGKTPAMLFRKSLPRKPRTKARKVEKRAG